MARRRTGPPTQKLSEASAHEGQLQNALLQIEDLQESLADVVLALDNVGTRPLGEDVDASEIPLDTVKNNIQMTRGLLAINPLIKRGAAVRASYVWGDGYTFEGIEEDNPILKDAKNKKWIFSPQANIEMEKCLFTDGNIFVLLTKGNGRFTDSIERVPFSQITGTVSNPDNKEDIWFYKREWERRVTRYKDGEPVARKQVEYFPSDDYDRERYGAPKSIGGVKVNYASAMLHKAGEKQSGWKWGVADSITVVFWSMAYKEFLETMATLVKAYARFAWKVTTPSRGAANSAATRVAKPSQVNPLTGEVENVGATAVAGMGTTLSAVGRTGGSVDFGAGLPLAAMVAAGLEIPLTALTADAGSANRSAGETLEEPTLKAMMTRQKLWSDFFERLFRYFGHEDVKTIWPRIDVEPTLKAVQAIMAAIPSNLLHDDEVREYLMKALGIDNNLDKPTEEDMENLMLAATKAAEAAEKAAEQQAAAQDQASKDKSANPNYGDHSDREAEGYHKTEPGTKN